MIKQYNYVPFLDDGEPVTYNNFYYWNGVFSNEDCDKIIQLGFQYRMQDATVESAGYAKLSVDEQVRRSKIAWMAFNDNTAWIYERIHEYAVKTNREMKWDFSLYGFIDHLQFTEYKSEYKGHYGYHHDIVANTTIRKLSCVLQLSEETDYTGGDFEFPGVGTVTKKRGSLIYFPSFLVHRVLPVLSGTRYSLVSWISGPKFV